MRRLVRGDGIATVGRTFLRIFLWPRNHGCPGSEAPEQVGARVDRMIARSRAVDGEIALFAHGHVLRVLAAAADRVLGHHFTSATCS